jgi:hypothetical protein
MTPALYLEMTDLTPEAYESQRLREVLRRTGVERASLWANQRPGRSEFPRTVPEFETLAVFEATPEFSAPEPTDAVRGLHFRRTARPGQGRLTGNPTLGLELVFVSPRTEAGAQALRDWADFLHIREIAAAAVPGFAMITPYENAGASGPRFMHFYEMDTADAEAAFQAMTPTTLERLRPHGRERIKEWAGHPELVIDYVNTFARVSVAVP